MNSQKGFIQIPILIAIIVGVFVVGGAGYVVVKKYQNSNNSPLLENIISQANRKVLSNTEIVDRIKPATVFIETEEGAGSGMIIDTEGHILTNAHVVWDASAAKIKLSDGKALSAEVVGRDEIIDLAILKIVGTDLPKVIFGDSDNVTQGEDVFTLGYPFGLEGDVSFKEGTISRTIKTEDATYLETSAEIHPGNSGGPLVNKYGEVVGINTASFGQEIKGVTVGETIKLAIPINVAKDLIPALKNGRKIVIDHKQYKSEPEPPASRPTPPPPSQSQVLQDKANQALLDELEKKDTDEAWKMTYMYNDAWRDNPARNCKNEATYSYDIALFIMQGLQDKMVEKYGSSLNWVNGIQHIYKSWCTDRGY